MQLREQLFYKMIHGNMWEMTVLGVDVYHIISWLFIFSFLGWVWETAFVSIKSKKLINRGFVTGPVCTIYGAGAVSVYLILRPLDDNYLAIFFMGMFVATVLEYVTSAVMEKLFRAKWWDYSGKKYNLNGRICLGASVGWGVMSLTLFLILMPFADFIMSLYPKVVGEIGLCVCLILYGIDFTLASVAAFNLSEKLQSMEQAMEEMGEKVRASKAYERLTEAIDELEERVDLPAYPEVREKWESFKKQLVKNQDRISRRFIKAYPKLSENLNFSKEDFERMIEEIKNKIDKNKKEG